MQLVHPALLEHLGLRLLRLRQPYRRRILEVVRLVIVHVRARRHVAVKAEQFVLVRDGALQHGVVDVGLLSLLRHFVQKCDVFHIASGGPNRARHIRTLAPSLDDGFAPHRPEMIQWLAAESAAFSSLDLANHLATSQAVAQLQHGMGGRGKRQQYMTPDNRYQTTRRSHVNVEVAPDGTAVHAVQV